LWGGRRTPGAHSPPCWTSLASPTPSSPQRSAHPKHNKKNCQLKAIEKKTPPQYNFKESKSIISQYFLPNANNGSTKKLSLLTTIDIKLLNIKHFSFIKLRPR
jgi:hypothetical protein